MQINKVQNFRNPQFGMAVKLDKSAKMIIKRQAVNMSETKYNDFWDHFDSVVEQEKSNPVDIIVRKCKHRKALAADVIDNSDEPLEIKTFAQGRISPSGLKFLDRAQVSAKKVNDMNSRLERYAEPLSDIEDREHNSARVFVANEGVVDL